MIRKGGIIVFLSLAVAGCSGEPSQSDMKETYFSSEAYINFMTWVIILSGGEPDVYGIQNSATLEDKLRYIANEAAFKKLECVKGVSAPGYICEFQLSWTRANGELGRSNVIQGRFHRSQDGWLFSPKK